MIIKSQLVNITGQDPIDCEYIDSEETSDGKLIINIHQDWGDNVTHIENLKVYVCNIATCDSDGKPIKETLREVCVLFNQTQISEEEVQQLFEEDRWKFDHRVTPITREQLKMLQDKKET